jgi:hypothetical protein
VEAYCLQVIFLLWLVPHPVQDIKMKQVKIKAEISKDNLIEE